MKGAIFSEMGHFSFKTTRTSELSFLNLTVKNNTSLTDIKIDVK